MQEWPHFLESTKKKELTKKGGYYMEDNREFVAFSRKLLRDFIQIKKLMEKGEYEKVKSMIDELIEDTQKDIET